MTDNSITDRQRQAEKMANSQIPGLDSVDDKGALNDPAASPAMASDGRNIVAVSRDYIDVSGAPNIPPDAAELEQITKDVIDQLKSVYDPEIPVDIYELGLIYKVELEDDRTLKVDMTLTAPGCPVAGEMPVWVQEACEVIAGVRRVEVAMTFDPPWTPDRMSDEAKLELNML